MSLSSSDSDRGCLSRSRESKWSLRSSKRPLALRQVVQVGFWKKMSLVGMRFLFWLKLFGKFVIEVLRASPVKATGVQIPDLFGCHQNDIVALFSGLITLDACINL